MSKEKENKLVWEMKKQVDYIVHMLVNLDEEYDNRENEFEVHRLFGKAMGALKVVNSNLQEVIKDA